MPVLRSREIPKPSAVPSPPPPPPPPLLPHRRRRRPPPPPPLNDPHTPSSEDTAPRKTPRSSSQGSVWARRLRRTLRLPETGEFDLKVECVTEADEGTSGCKRQSNEGKEIGGVDLNSQVMDTGKKGKSVAMVAESANVLGKYTREEKGKGTSLGAENSGTDVDGDGSDAIANAGDSISCEGLLDRWKMDWEEFVPVVNEEVVPALSPTGVAAAPDAIDHCRARRERDRERALASAPKFALYAPEECPEDEMDEDDNVFWEPAAEYWPGPFATAEKILSDRAKGVSCQFPEMKSSHDEIPWIPSVRPKRCRAVPSLKNLCIDVLAENADEIESLDGIPVGMREQISFLLCRSRKLDFHFLSLLSNGHPTEICIPDCSWATEEGVKDIFAKCNTEELEVLKLHLSGRCLPDYILCSTLAHSPNSLPKLTTVSLSGDYRLSDIGLNSLVCSAPMLCSVNLSQCSLLTSAGITMLAEKLEAVLRELILDDCLNIDAMGILPALKRVKNLEKLSVCGVQSVNSKFVSGFLSVHGAKMKALGFAGCRKVSHNSFKAIGMNCLQLCDLDLRNLLRLDDNAIKYIAKACVSIRKLKFQHSDCSDEAVAAFLDASGRCLEELSLNNFREVGHKTAVSICRHCTSLQILDLSFCRMMTNEALGLIVDSCSNLKILKLFGCTQVTDVFLNGHSNPRVEIIGLQGSILKRLDKEPGYC